MVQTEAGFDYVVTGSGFLYNMVRVLVAFLIEVGKGSETPTRFHNSLKKNRNNVPFTAPSEGLYLEKVYLSPESLKEEFGNDIKIHLKNRWKMIECH